MVKVRDYKTSARQFALLLVAGVVLLLLDRGLGVLDATEAGLRYLGLRGLAVDITMGVLTISFVGIACIYALQIGGGQNRPATTEDDILAEDSLVNARTVVERLRFDIDENGKATAAGLLHETERHDSQSVIFLFCIGGVFTLMLLGIVFAGYLTRVDLNFVSPAKPTEERASKLERRLSCLHGIVSILQRIDDTEVRLRNTPPAAPEVKGLSDTLSELRSAVRRAGDCTQDGLLEREAPVLSTGYMTLQSASSLIEDCARELAETRKEAAEWRRAIRNRTTEENDKSTLGNTNVIRFGISAISIYLVSILLGVYRFKVQMSSYYKRKFDAFVMSKGVIRDFTALNALLEKERFELEPAPRTPLEAFLNFFSRRSSQSGAPGNDHQSRHHSSRSAASPRGQRKAPPTSASGATPP
jgi:hypothetical protein